MPVEIDLGSEFRYRPAGGLALFISQSSETADTLAASRYAHGQKRGWTAGSITACQSRLDRPMLRGLTPYLDCIRENSSDVFLNEKDILDQVEGICIGWYDYRYR